MSAKSYRGRPVPCQPLSKEAAPRILLSLLVGVLLLFPLLATAQAELTIGDAEAPSGAAVEVPFTLTRNLTQPATIVLRIAFPDDALDILDVQPTALLGSTGHSLDYEVSTPGELRIVMVGQGVMAEGILCRIYVRIAASAAVGSMLDLTDNGSNGSTPQGAVLNTVFVPGTVSVVALSGQHTADQDGDWRISLSELLRVIQFYNLDEYHCDAAGEDGYAPGPGDQSCATHDSDYNPANWTVSLTELLRLIQFFNILGGAYHPDANGEDSYAPGAF
ncbi:MAG: hypothetical protein IT368_07195 [Candidatus Hydrogenedentes bacterium]|nr:hypothetical protein [Candidatus Hydrogenedentota bacterium]